MLKRLFTAALAFVAPAAGFAGTGTSWVLERSDLKYEVSHPLHHVEATSTAAKGKGTETGGAGQFLIAVPVKSFESGDTNRDSHMLQVTKAGLYPMVVVRANGPVFAQAALPRTIKLAATVEFAGKKVAYPELTFSVTSAGDGRLEVTGLLPLSLKAYEIEPPSLLAVPVKDEVPIHIVLVWKRQDAPAP